MNQKKKPPRKLMALWAALVLAVTAFPMTAFAADDPLTIVNNLGDFFFSCIRAIGIIVLGWGVVQVAMSIQSHDASQRTPGLPLPLRRATHHLCQGDPGRHRRAVKNASQLGTH